MSTKHFCDGCDKQVERHSDLKRVEIVTITPGHNIRGISTSGPIIESDQRSDTYPSTANKKPVWMSNLELCGECFQRFKDTLPPRWERFVAPTAA